MKRQQIIVVLSLAFVAFARVEGYGLGTASSFVSRPPLGVAVNAISLRMDTEGDAVDRESRSAIENALFRNLPSWGTIVPKNAKSDHASIEQAHVSVGMPWRESIGDYDGDTLLYMPFWDWQMEFMKENLSNLKVEACTNHAGTADFSINSNDKKKARIVNLCFSSDEYRKIRMTYYDAGDHCQVFNSLWYPHPSFNLPVLGIDLLAFNRKKYLTVVDFQPLHADEADHASSYEHVLKSIRKNYNSLKGQMSSKFYDETQFFSQQMLFARFEDEGIINDELMPAFQRYVEVHLDMLQNTTPEVGLPQMRFVLERQGAYDTYSAERDPATALFAAMFGKDWADEYVHEFLFSMSERPRRDFG